MAFAHLLPESAQLLPKLHTYKKNELDFNGFLYLL